MPSKISVKIIVFFLLGALIAPMPGLAEYTLQPGEDICGDGFDTNGDGLDPTPYQCSCPESVNAGNSSTLVKMVRENILLVTEDGKKYLPVSAYGVCPLTEKLEKEIKEAMAKTPKTKTTTEMFYYHTDHLGGTSVVTDEQGEVVEVLDYYPYGDTRISEQTRDGGTQRKFTGQEEDPESDLYYYGARYYDPSIGRFTQQDPVARDNPEKFVTDPQQLNTYSYTRNNPVNFIDPEGLETKIYIEKGNTKDGYKSIAGHAFLEINRDGESLAYSWSPRDSESISGPLEGQDLAVDSIDNFLSEEGKNADEYAIYTFKTSEEQEGKIKKFYADLRDANMSWDSRERILFSPVNYNCTDVVVDAMKAGGIVSPDFSPNVGKLDTPGGLESRLESKYRWQTSKLSGVFRWFKSGGTKIIKDISSMRDIVMDLRNKDTIINK